MPLYSTEVSPSGVPAAHPFTLHANAAAAQALDVLRRTLDEETARELAGPRSRARGDQSTFRGRRRPGNRRSPSAIDLAGGTSVLDDPAASVFWLPMYEAASRQDSTYRRTVKAIDVTPQSLTQQCARLMGPDASKVSNGSVARHWTADGPLKSWMRTGARR